MPRCIWKHFLLLFFLSLAQTALEAANLTPIAASGYNRDIVVENTASGPPFSAYALEYDPGSGLVYYQAGLPGKSYGLPVSGSFTSVYDGTTVFQFQPYTTNNALILSSETGLTAGTLTLATPTTYSQIAVIANSASASPSSVGVVTFHFNDGSSFVTNYNAFDWFYNPGYALRGVDRIYLSSGATEGGPNGDPRFYQTTINLAAALGASNRPLSSVTFGKASAANSTAIYAISGLPAGVNSSPAILTTGDQFISEGPVSLQLSATVQDDGLPLPANPSSPDPNDPKKLRWGWSVLATPLTSAGVAWSGNPNSGEAFDYQGSSNAPFTTFTSNPTAFFDVPGSYLLSFFAFDGEVGSTNQVKVVVKSTGAYRQLGYQYLSPIPGSEYTLPQTRYVLIRFSSISPGALTNLSSFVRVTGAMTGNHAGLTHVASDNRTVIFTMSTDFSPGEIATVSLAPGTSSGPAIAPYQYQFVVAGHMPDPPLITVRGENVPLEGRNRAFDGNTNTQWRDLVVPNGTNNFSWIQYVYPNAGTHVINQYALTSGTNAPERDPQSWNLYGVDLSGNLTLVDTQSGQSFAARQQRNVYAFSNVLAYAGYRLEITQVSNPAIADSVQLAELEFIPATGLLLRQYWLGIPGAAVSNLTSNPNYPTSPSGSSLISTFEAPINWADNYGTRIRGYITAPATGNYTFWIESDDASELWLGSNDTPGSKALVAYQPGATGIHEWTKYASQKSAPISLTAGTRYYVEALQKEAGGADHVAVAWAKPGQSTNAPSEIISGEVLSPWVGGPSIASVKNEPAAHKSSQNSAPGTAGLDTLPTTRRKIERTHANSQATATVSLPSHETSSARSPEIASNGSQRHRLASTMPNGVSVPSDFPFISITTSSTNADPNPIFLNGGSGAYIYDVIFDNSGSPIWYMREPDDRRDFKVQANGMLTMLARDNGNYFNQFNTNYQFMKSYWASNGYAVDQHELQILADGTYLLIGAQSQTIDMSRLFPGGNPAASIEEHVIQEFTPQGDLIFQWRAWDQIDVRDQASFIDLSSSSFDFPHMNSLDVDTDGHILLSSRSTSECTKINKDTGRFIWRLGGAHSDFTFVNDPLLGTRNQHCFRRAGTNTYMIYDNGDQHNPSQSRGVQYTLDLTNKTATIVWQYPPTTTPSIYGWYMGNVQLLTNGSRLINWAVYNLPKLTEIAPNGTKVFEMNWVNQYETYRVWRCPWRGVALQPYLILEPYPDNLTLIMNQFGDTNVAYYRIYGGTSPQPTNLLAESGTTLKQLSNLQNGLWYFRVTAVNKSGVEGPYSNEASTTVNIIPPGKNMVSNGDFSQGTNSWSFNVSSTASASWAIESGASHFYITNGGTTVASVQLLQSGFALVQNRKYVFEFDAWASQPRYIDVKLAQSASPFTDYSKITTPFLTPTRAHFRYVFTMTSPSDFSANMLFNLGSAPVAVYLDNISLYNPPVGDLNQDSKVDYLDLGIFSSSWMKQQGGLPADLDGSFQVDFKDFSIFGENWWTVWH
jgi:hypothetical protein